MKITKGDFEINIENKGDLVAGTIVVGIAMGGIVFLGKPVVNAFEKLMERQDLPEVVEKATNVIYMNKYKPNRLV